MKIPFPMYSARKAILLMMICVILGLSASWGIAEYTQKMEEFKSSVQWAPEEAAKEAFMQTHTESIARIFCMHHTETKYVMVIYYWKWVNNSEGDFLFQFRIGYDIYHSGEIEPSSAVPDTCYSFVLRFIGKQPITSKEQANQTYFMLIDRSPWGSGLILITGPIPYMFQIGTGEPVIAKVNITETNDHYEVTAGFWNTFVKTPYAACAISYNIYKNGTAAFIRLTGTPVYYMPPMADAGPNQKVRVKANVTFDAKDSSDNMGIVSYEWDFGDGTTGIGLTANHTYTKPGTYIVTLVVRDAAGYTDTDSLIVIVEAVSVGFIPWIIGVVAVAGIIATIAIYLLKMKKPVE